MNLNGENNDENSFVRSSFVPMWKKNRIGLHQWKNLRIAFLGFVTACRPFSSHTFAAMLFHNAIFDACRKFPIRSGNKKMLLFFTRTSWRQDIN